MEPKKAKLPHYADETLSERNCEQSSSLTNTTFYNISACKEYGEMIRTVYGPKIKNKIVVDHIEKQISLAKNDEKKIPELEVLNPAVKLMIEESRMQEKQASGGPNFVIIFCSSLLEKSEELLKLGFTCDDIINFFNTTLEKALEIMKTLKCNIKIVNGAENIQCIQEAHFQEALKIFKSIDFKNRINNDEKNENGSQLQQQPSSSSGLNFRKHPWPEPAPPQNYPGNVNLDVVYSTKLRCFFENYKIKKSKKKYFWQIRRNANTEPIFKSIHKNTKIAVYNFPVSYLVFDLQYAEVKNDYALRYGQDEVSESKMEQVYNDLKTFDERFTDDVIDSNIFVVVAFGKFDDFAMFFMKENGIMGISCESKFDLNRICRLTNTKPLNNFWDLLVDAYQSGQVYIAYEDNLGDSSVAVIRAKGRDENNIRTVVVRNITDDGIDLKTSKNMDSEGLPGGGATEIEIAKQLISFTNESFENRLAAKKFADALEVFPKTLAENVFDADVDGIIKKLYAAHNAGNKNFGINTEVEKEESCIVDTVESGICDVYETKLWGFKCGVNAATKILKLC